MEIEALERTRHDDEINWVTAGFMLAFHIGAIAAIFFFTWKALFVAAFKSPHRTLEPFDGRTALSFPMGLEEYPG